MKIHEQMNLELKSSDKEGETVENGMGQRIQVQLACLRKLRRRV